MNMNELKEKFFELSPRDQLVLVAGVAAVLLYILIFVILVPAQAGVTKQQKKVHASLTEQQRVQTLAGQVLGARQSGGGTSNQSINGLLNSTLGEYGLRMENFQPSGNGARVRIGSAEFSNVLGWLHEMEIKQGVQIKDLTITAAEVPGAVLVSLQLQQGE